MKAIITEPRALKVADGVDLYLPKETPINALEAFVTSCNVGECGCADTFVARVAAVELFEEIGHLRVHITGNVTPDEVLAEMFNSAVQDLA